MFIRTVRLLSYIILSSVAFAQANAAEPEYKLPESSYELLLRMTYGGAVNYDLLAVTYNKKHYLPFLEIVNKLRIFNEYDYTSKIIKGYLVDKDSTFYMDFRIGAGNYNGKEIRLEKDEYLIDMMEVYVVPEVFERLFGFEAILKYLKLSLRIRSKFDLPVKFAYKRVIHLSEAKKLKKDSSRFVSAETDP
jgi:hypothetical protein